MNVKEVLRGGLQRARTVTDMLLDGLSDADLLTRPVQGSNHIAWQLGHLISSEHSFGEMIQAGSMPALPPGFAEQHDGGQAGNNDPRKFLKKEDYVRIYGQQRQALLALLDRLDEKDLDRPVPEPIGQIAPTVASLIQLAGDHELMHAGQFTPVRRMLGKPVAF